MSEEAADTLPYPNVTKVTCASCSEDLTTKDAVYHISRCGLALYQETLTLRTAYMFEMNQCALRERRLQMLQLHLDNVQNYAKELR